MGVNSRSWLLVTALALAACNTSPPVVARVDRACPEGATVVVLAVEQELRPLSAKVLFEGGGLALQLGGQFGVARFLDQLEGGEELLRPILERVPQFDLGPQAVGLPKDRLGCPLVVPEPGLAGQCFQLRDALGLGV